MERVHDYRGLYRMPRRAVPYGVGPSDIHIRELLTRLQDNTVRSSLPPTTILRARRRRPIWRAHQAHNVRVTRIAHGVPVGSDLEYADEITLSKALEGRL